MNRAVTLVHERAQPPRADGSVHVNLTAAVFEIDEGS